jgi:hypothetical protein
MHATIRRWTGASKLIDEMERRSQDVENIISSSPGFVAYYGVRSGDTLISITLCQDKAGTDESTRLAGQWVRENLPDEVTAGLTPEVMDGNAFMSFAAPQRVAAAALGL